MAFDFPALWRDKFFRAAVIAAPLVWLGLFILLRPAAPGLWFVKNISVFLLFLMPVLVYPVLEEIAFRGLIQETFYAKSWGKKMLGPLSHANLITSALFVLAHFFYHPPIWAISVLAPSLVFGFFRDKYGSVVPSILLHVFYNLGYVWLFNQPVAS